MKMTYRYPEIKIHFGVWQDLGKHGQWAKSRPTTHVGNDFMETQPYLFHYIIVYSSHSARVELGHNRDGAA